MPTWPRQSECDAYYGNPRSRDPQHASVIWEALNLTSIKPPFVMTYAGAPIRGIRIHRKCADSLSRVLARMWDMSGRNQPVLDHLGASIFGGSYNFRLMRNGRALSMHSWGCAIDLDPARNGLGDATPNFQADGLVVKAFEAEGWTWGGRWSAAGRDGMHFQAATVG